MVNYPGVSDEPVPVGPEDDPEPFIDEYLGKIIIRYLVGVNGA